MRKAQLWADDFLNRFCLPIKGNEFNMAAWIEEIQRDAYSETQMGKEEKTTQAYSPQIAVQSK